MAAAEDRLSDLPDSLILHILYRLHKKEEIVRSSVLSTRWRFLWKSVPVSASFIYIGEDEYRFIANTHKELHYLRSFSKIHDLHVDFPYDMLYTKDIDFWVYFVTRVAHVECFTLSLNFEGYELPQFAYNSSSLNKLVLFGCKLKPCGSISWSRLSSLSFDEVDVTDVAMKEILSGCPNLDCLRMVDCHALRRLEFRSVKLRKFIIRNCWNLFEIVAPYVQILEVSGLLHLQLIDVPSLVTVVLNLDEADYDEESTLGKQSRYFKELFDNLVHVKNLKVNPFCIELLSMMERKGWQLPASRRILLTVNTALRQQDFPAICGLLQSSPELETLVIHWSEQTSGDEMGSRMESYFNYSLLHLKTIKIIFSYQQPSEDKFIMPFVKHLLKHAQVLEKLIICYDFKGRCLKMEQVILSFPRSSQHAVVVFTTS